MGFLGDVLILASQYFAQILLLLILGYFAQNYLKPGVSAVPGPFLAKFSHLWRFLDVARGHAEETHVKLHRKHGQYVRLGPDVVSVCNLDVLKQIYGINKGFEKTRFYAVQQQLVKGKPVQTLFTTLDEGFHANIKRPVSGAYSMSLLTEFEPFVDSTISVMIEKLEDFVKQDKVCDMAAWLQYYAFDVIGEITFSRRLGFLEEAKDVGGIIQSIENMLNYAGKVGQMPWLDYVFLKNPLRRIMDSGATGAVAQFARARLAERLQLLESSTQTDGTAGGHKDFLTRFLDAKKTYPQVVTDQQVFSYTLSNVNAGSDTTAISLRAVLYYTLKNPRVLQRLNEELQGARRQGRLSLPAQWKETQELPYLDAVIKEALRLHPAVGLLLERVVPSSGLQLPDGPFLPAGTIVGVNPWVIHRHDCFGANVDSFHPERWLQRPEESREAFEARKQVMNGATYTFGAGPRTCIGKNISLLEIYKLIPSLLCTFKIELDKPEADWQTWNAWFVGQTGMDVKLSRL